MGVFSIDSWDLIKQDKQIKCHRQAVSVAREIVPLVFFITKAVALSRDFVPLE